MQKTTITTAKYATFQKAYDYFNAALFAASPLPQVMITLQRHAKAYGYFHANQFANKTDGEVAHELAMNPDHFTRDDRDVLATLVHEMCHVWQQIHGKAPRTCYHDRQWAAQMHAVGLHPSSTAAPGGKETGQKVSHYIVDGGAFDRAYARLAGQGFRLEWAARGQAKAEREKKAASKTRYTCPACGTNAWAKPQTALICGACYEDDGEATVMEAAAVEAETEA